MQDISAEVQGNYESKEGLRIKDFPELKIKNGEAIFKKIPTMVIVRIQILEKFVSLLK